MSILGRDLVGLRGVLLFSGRDAEVLVRQGPDMPADSPERNGEHWEGHPKYISSKGDGSSTRRLGRAPALLRRAGAVQ